MSSLVDLVKKTLLRVIAFTFSASIGAIIFSVVERPNADNKSKTKERRLDSLQNEMRIKYNMTPADFENFSKSSCEAFSLDGPVWNYVDGLRFSFETLTTIGYGNISPSTDAGQALCIVFALLGIPVTILAFQSVGELMSRGITFVIVKIEKQCFKRDPTNVEAKCTAVTCALMLVMLLCGAAGMQMSADNWSFLVGFYFWFVTFTTIGYGDYIPDKTGKGWGVVFHLIWTTLGLCVVSSALNALATLMPRRQACMPCSCFHGNRVLEDTERNGEKENEHEKKENENGMNENEKNGREAFGVDSNGTGTRKEKDQYNSVTYV